MNHAFKSWLMWCLTVTFFAFQFVLRVFPGLIVPEITTKFKIDATSFGFLSAAYYLGYAGMQIPVGMLLDRFNIRYVISGCIFLCTLGTLSFVYSDIWALTVFGRFLIGAGSAAGFLGTAKAIRLSFPDHKFAGMVGVSFTVGLMGALYGGKPVSLLIGQFGWTSVLKCLALFSFVLALSVLFLFPNEEKESKVQEVSSSLLKSLAEVLKNWKLIGIGIAGALMVGPLEGFADIWGVSYLVKVHGFSQSDASLVTSCIYFGMLFGGPILSFLAQRFNAYHAVTALCGLLMAAVFTFLLLTDIPLSHITLMVLMTFVGILCCYQVIVFALACQLVPSRLSGIVTSVTNCINMSAGCLLHLIMGWIMDYHWRGTLEDGIRVYDSYSYSSAVSVIPITLILGFVGFIMARVYVLPSQEKVFQ